jgi:hypothetical protein
LAANPFVDLINAYTVANVALLRVARRCAFANLQRQPDQWLVNENTRMCNEPAWTTH